VRSLSLATTVKASNALAVGGARGSGNRLNALITLGALLLALCALPLVRGRAAEFGSSQPVSVSKTSDAQAATNSMATSGLRNNSRFLNSPFLATNLHSPLLSYVAPPVSAPTFTFTVNTLSDDINLRNCSGAPNDCSLRGALFHIEHGGDNAIIEFDPSLGGGIHFSPELAISTPVTFTINGGGTGLVSELGVRAFAIYDSRANVTLNDLIIEDARPGSSNDNGAGIFNQGTLNLINSTVRNNITENANGGGIFNNGGTVNITNSTVSNNHSGVDGGGIYNSAGVVNVINSTLSGNETTNISINQGGGGIYNSAGVVNVINSTLSGNSSDYFGGGIYNSAGTVNLTNSTVSGNLAFGDGGGIYMPQGDTGTVSARNSIIFGNTRRGMPDPPSDISGTLTSQGYNLIGDTTETTITGTTTGNIYNQNAQLGDLQNNGGGTFTHALLPNSPARNAGSNALALDLDNQPLTTDQRGAGFPRIFGGTVDMGAFEFSLDQTITFGALAGKTFGDPDFGVSATASSGLSVSFGATGNCTVTGNTVHLTGAGSCTITAKQAGDANYHAAADVPQSFNIAKANQTITVGTHAPPNAAYNASFTVAATSDSGLAVSYSSSGSCTNVGAVFTMTSGTGTCTVKYDQAGNSNYNMAAEATESVSSLVIYTVDNTTDNGGLSACTAAPNDCSLRGAIANANNPGPAYLIEFDAAVFSTVKTITLGGSELAINSNTTMTIDGGGKVIVSANIQSRVLTISGGANATLNGLTIRDGRVSIFSGGSDGQGGGISIVSGTLTLTNSTISGNSSDNGGGGIVNRGGTLNVINSTISSNSTTTNGGGIHNSATATANLTNSTIAGNFAVSDSGGGIAGGGIRNDGTLNSRNSIIGGNTANFADDVSGTLTSQGYNLIGNTEDTAILGVATGNVLDQNPQLGALQDNGGGTFTHALLSNSPARNAGSNALALDLNNQPLTTDQRGAGFPRIVAGTVDMGAFEFGSQTITVTTHAPASAANNSSFTVAATSTSGLPVTYTSAGACSNVGRTFTMTAATGSCTVKYDQAGDSNYIAATQVTESVTALKANQTITVGTHAPPSAAYNASFTVAATSNSGLAISYSSAGVCTNVGAVFTMTSGTGTCMVQYDQAGDGNYSAAPQVIESVTAQKANQSITVGTHAPPSAAYNASFTVAATSNPGLAVSYSSSGSCTNVGAVFTMTSGTGACTVKYDQAGDGNYSAATQVTESVTAQKIGQTITVGTHAPANAAYNASFTVAATSNSGLAVSYSSFGSCTNVGAVFTMTSGAGTCTVKYDQAGDGNYNAASQVTESVTAQKANQTITVGTHAPPSAAYNASFTVAATSNSGLAVSYSSAGVCTNVGAVFTITSGAGTCTVKYDQAGDGNYNAASQMTESVTAQKANQTTTVGTHAPPSAAYKASFTVAATSNSGLAVSYSSAGSCTNVGAVFTMTSGTGTCTVKYDQAGDGNYNAATQVTESVTAQKIGQTITVGTHAPSQAPYLTTFTVAATSNSSLAVTYSSAGVCTNVGATFTITASSGTCTVKYDQAGDGNYNPATEVTETVTAQKADTTTTITNAALLGATASVTGQSYAVNWSVTVNSPGSGTPTGNVQVSDGAGGTCTAALSAGTCNVTSTTVGAKTITAAYQGDSNYNANTSSGASHTVNQAGTTTVITNAATLSSTPTVVGQSAAVQWSVTVNSPGSGTPTGTVTVSDGTNNCNASVAAGQCSFTPIAPINETLIATYGGETNFSGSSSTGASHGVNKANTTTALTNAATLNSTPTVVGQAYTVQWSVTVNSPGAGTPTGTVTVDDGAASCNAAVAAGQCSLTSTSPGAKTITAQYGGNANFNGSASAGAAHTVNKAATSTSITNAASLNSTPTVVGQSYTVTWSVTVNSPGTGTPSGTVTVDDGAGSCNAAVAAGQCSLTSTTAGAKTITATYGGDANFNGSTSAGAAHTLNKAATSTSITNAASLNSTPTVVGQSYTVTWSVTVNSPGAGTPTGTVTVDDGAASCNAAVAAGQCSLTSTTAGAKTITATYGGDGNFNSGNTTTAHPVNKADTTTTITNAATLSSTHSLDGQAYVVQWSVTVNSPGAGSPTGNVQVSDGTATCSAAVTAGQCNLTSTSPGAKTITANYQSDANFNSSASIGVSHTVDPVADLSVTKGAAATVLAGNNLTYTIAFTNNGLDSAQTVTVADALPGGTTFVSAGVTTGTGWSMAAPSVGGTGNVVFSKGTVANAETALFSIVVKVAANVANNTIISNSTTAATATADTNSGNNTGTAMTTVQTRADLAVTSGNTPNPVTAGTNLTYTLNFSSAGPSNAQTVTVTDPLPTGTTFVSAAITTGTGWSATVPAVGNNGTITFSKATVLPSETAVFTIVAYVNSSVAANATLSNSATAASATTDPAPGNNIGTAQAAVQRQSDLAVTKTVTEATAIPGQNLHYTVTFVNNGPSDAANSTVTDAVPANTTFVSAGVTAGSGWSINAPAPGGTGNVVFSKVAVALGETAMFSVVVNVNLNPGNTTGIMNTATVSSDSTDTITANNSATVTVSLFDTFIYDQNQRMLLRFSSVSGFWQFFACAKNISASGFGVPSVSGCKITLAVGMGKGGSTSVNALANTCTKTGTATVRVNGATYTLTDPSLNGGTFSCPF
jgi:uncharacterized repeat protein (TIGR01451 family)